MIIFNRIRYKNLLSVGNVPLEISLDENKNTLVVGPNGQGKSILLDAICFSLYGKAYRKINKPALINSINGKDTLVEIEFTIGTQSYLIRRGMKPNIFEIYCNGNLVNQDSASRDYQQYLEQNILKIDFKSFLQVVILGSANFVPFMQLPAQHRREIIEELLDIQVFSLMNNILKDHIQESKNDLSTAEHGLTILHTKLELIKKHASEIKGLKEKSLADKIQVKERLTLDYLNLATQLQKVKDEYAELKEKTPALQRLFAKYQSKVSKINTETARMEALERKKKGLLYDPVCPTCNQKLSDDILNSHIVNIENEQSLMQSVIDELNEFVTKLAGIKQTVEDHNKANTDLQHKMQELQFELKQTGTLERLAKEQIKELQAELEEKDDGEVEEIRKQIELAESRKSGILVDQEVLQICSVLLKDGGIKARIIAQYIPVINKLINKYLNAMDFFVQFELDTSFNETIKSRYRDDFSYESFSEGEKTRIDLALLFSWRALAKLRNSMSTNLLIFDEILDSSLDSSGMDELLKIIDQLTGETNVIVISHRDAMFDKFQNVMRFQKVKGFTRLME